jgi:cobyrinic acid a,c-diamide synthase
MSRLISKAFQGGASNVQLLVTPDLMFEKGLNPRSKKVPQGKVWNGGYPSKLSSYLHEQRSPCCPILPFFGQDANRLGRCGGILILAISLLIALVRIHNSHQTLGPCPTSLVIPLHKWTRTFNDLHIQLGNLGISHTERDCMHGHEPDGTWHANI